jgi:hypothetical protein
MLVIEKEDNMQNVIIAIVMVFCLAVPVWADSGFKEGAKEVGQGFKEGSKKIGQGVQDLGKDIKEGSKEGAENFK